MKEILLTQGKVALVDDEDFEWLNQWKWYAHKNRNTFYAERALPVIGGKQDSIKMHHEIIGRPPINFMTDHRNGHGLDNRRKNLRFVTNRENCQNRHIETKVSQYPGIHWHKGTKKWMARIRIGRIRKYLGIFDNEFEAFSVYRQAVECLGQTVIDYD